MPKRVLSWWWSMLRMWSPSRWRKSTGIRSMLPQSRNTIARSSTSSGGAPTRRSKVQLRYSQGSGNSSGEMYISESLPSCSRMRCIASSEPSASPSGFSCVVSRNRSAWRSAATTWSCSVATVTRRAAPRCASRARIDSSYEKTERRGALHAQLPGDRLLHEPVRGAQAGQRLLLLLGAAEHAHEHASVAKVGACVYGGHRHESYARVVEALRDSAREDLPDRLVHPAHAVRGHSNPRAAGLRRTANGIARGSRRGSSTRRSGRGSSRARAADRDRDPRARR